MKSRKGHAWRELAYHWQEIATWRGQALEKVWSIVDAVADPALAQEIRAAMVGDFILSDSERANLAAAVTDDEDGDG